MAKIIKINKLTKRWPKWIKQKLWGKGINNKKHTSYQYLTARAYLISTYQPIKMDISSIVLWSWTIQWRNVLQIPKLYYFLWHRSSRFSSRSCRESLRRSLPDHPQLRSCHSRDMETHIQRHPQPQPSLFTPSDDVLRMLQRFRAGSSCLDSRRVSSLALGYSIHINFRSSEYTPICWILMQNLIHGRLF